MEADQPYHGVIRGKAHHFALRVYIEDTDLGGVVYHANYLRYLERARSDLLRCVGINQRAAFEKGEGIYAVTEMQLKYRRPAKLDDELMVVSEVVKIGGASCVLLQKITRGEEIITEASVTVAFITPAGRPRRQPEDWVEKFERFSNPAPGL